MKPETKEQKRREKERARIQAEKDQKPIRKMTIAIEWKKSRTWGYNPHASAEIHYRDGSFGRFNGYTCSGCGYDKTSTVIAEIFNDHLKYKLWKKPFESTKIKKPYGIRFGKHESFQDRYYEGGVGMSCYLTDSCQKDRIAYYIGGTLKCIASLDKVDVFIYTDKRTKIKQ